MSAIPRGRFVWYELMTSDPDAAVDFYGRVVGWKTRTWQPKKPVPDMPPYRMWLNADTAIGGVMDLPEDALKQGAPPNWLAYVAVPDVDATADRVRKLGGHIHAGPIDIPEVGRFVVLADPQGATLSAFRPEGDAPGHDGDPQTGEASWHELMTTDYEKAFDFYSDIFGWEKIDDMDMGPAGVYRMYGLEGRMFGGMFNKTPDMPMPPCWLLYFKVDDVDKSADIVRKNGGQIINGPMEVPGGDRIVQCTDPQGAMFALHSAKK